MKRVMCYILLFTLVPLLLGACGEMPATQPAPTATLEPTDVPPAAEPTTAPQPAGELAVYDAAESFVLEYPAGWEIVQRPEANTVLFLTPQLAGDDLFRENLGVMRQELADPNTTVGTYTRDFLAAAPDAIDDYALVSSEPTRLSGLPAHRVIYGGTQNGLSLGWLQVWTISEGNAYVLTYTGDPVGFETYLENANNIIESFTLR